METINEPINIDALPIKVDYVRQTKRGDWECFEWRVTITSQAGFWTLPFYCGLGHVKLTKQMPSPPYRRGTVAYEEFMKHYAKPVRPSNSDILHSLILDASAADMNFHDWCADYGYSDDSIKALNTYKECLEIGAHLKKHFGRDAVEQLREQLRDY